MPSIEQTERFLSECLLYRTVLRNGETLSHGQKLLLKTKLYELIFDIETIKTDLSDLDFRRSL